MTVTSGNRTYLEYQLKDDPKPGAVLQKPEQIDTLLLLLKHYVTFIPTSKHKLFVIFVFSLLLSTLSVSSLRANTSRSIP